MEVLYFAWVRESVGAGQETLDPPENVRTVADLIEWLGERSSGHAEAFREPTRIRAAVDQRFVPLDAELGSAKEVALFPPVTGG
jgi:molybdopterin synthase sulfur carrier subunit